MIVDVDSAVRWDINRCETTAFLYDDVEVIRRPRHHHCVRPNDCMLVEQLLPRYRTCDAIPSVVHFLRRSPFN